MHGNRDGTFAALRAGRNRDLKAVHDPALDRGLECTSRFFMTPGKRIRLGDGLRHVAKQDDVTPVLAVTRKSVWIDELTHSTLHIRYPHATARVA
jgi:hypothetical protein